MCRPVSLIITEDEIFLPPEKVWNHSHTFIMKENNIPDGLIGDKYLRLEVTPPNNIFRDKETSEKLVVNNKWKVEVDETSIPDWYNNDLANQEYRAREAARKWFKNYPDNLVPGYKETGGDSSILFAGDSSILTAGYNSTLTARSVSILNAGHNSTLTAGNDSTLTSGNYSILTAGDNSTLTAGNNSALTAGDGSRLTAGKYSKLISGHNSILISGHGSVLTAGHCSELTAGDYSTLNAENSSVFCAGENSLFSSSYWDGKRRRTVTFYVGENGILPNKKYKFSSGKIYDEETGEEVKAKKAPKKTIKNKKKKINKKGK